MRVTDTQNESVRARHSLRESTYVNISEKRTKYEYVKASVNISFFVTSYTSIDPA